MELDGKWNNQDSNQLLHRMLVLQVEAWPAMPGCWPPRFLPFFIVDGGVQVFSLWGLSIVDPLLSTTPAVHLYPNSIFGEDFACSASQQRPWAAALLL